MPDLPVAAPDPAAELQRAKEWVRDYDDVTVEHEAGVPPGAKA